ncbi:MAG: hypothetical protein GF346_03565 [Candidatus Eisenbacteria bacterium]|nr:hypothetical protein [Candidatus Latescibacterota bacterium]MBD3301501.1 hypothetical protein [Candidatus Eisenbacteria bacterium]
MRPVLTLSVGLALFALGCGAARKGGPADRMGRLDVALAMAGANRSSLEAVLDRYSAPADSLKRRAAVFLIENMPGQSTIFFELVDTTGSPIDFDPLRHPDYDAMVTVLDSIEATHGPIDFERSERIADLETIEAAYLIENIELAFRAWRERPWARHLSFDTFCAAVLPHRGSNEPLERWRPTFFERYADLADRMDDPTDPVEAVRLINEDLRGWFRFDPRYYCHPTDQGLAEMLEHRAGRCEDMTNLAIYAMRANGLAVTSDYTPYWANAGNNHAWNAVLDREGDAVVFMGCEAHPGEYSLANAVAKVYRKGYAQQPGNLAFLAGEEQIPRWLSGKSTVDVTESYVPVSDVTVPLSVSPPEGHRFAYACVFNAGEWGALAWGRIADGAVPFTSLGRDVLYLPAYYDGERLIPAGNPFLLLEDGDVRTLAADEEERFRLEVRSCTRRADLESTEGIRVSYLRPGTEYTLHLWRGGSWEEIGRETAGEEPLRFEGVPTGGLYWLVEENSRREERVFTVRDGEQIWW